MTEPTTWNPGTADEIWKVLICARDAQRASDLLSGIAYILDNPGSAPFGQDQDVVNANTVRRFTGDQIADALLAFRDNSYTAVKRGFEAAKQAT